MIEVQGGRGEVPLGLDGSKLPERWSTQRKMELVLRLLRSESLKDLSWENQVPAHVALACQAEIILVSSR